MKAHKNISLIIFLFVLSIFQGCEKQSSESEKKAILKITDENTTWATGRDPTTNEDFSCIILLCQNQYIMGEPVRVKVRLTNQINRNVTIRDCVQHYPFYSFEVTDPAWRLLESSKKLKTSFTELNPEFKTIKPNESYYVEIDLADWYNLSQIGSNIK